MNISALDVLNRQYQVIDALGHSTTKYYDQAGRVWKVTDEMGRATLYTHGSKKGSGTPDFPTPEDKGDRRIYWVAWER